jgi:UV excision repair protein RAD23
MLEQLAQSPQMQQLRQVSSRFHSLQDTADKQMVQENPALIQPLMQQIATSNPQLAQLINQNPQALYDLLGGGAGGEEGEDDFLGAQVMHVDLTEAEAAAVERVSRFMPAARRAFCLS